MRKTTIAILMLAGLLLSCSKEAPKASEADFSLRASMPCADTKTSLGAKSEGVYPVLWSQGDVIMVNGVQSKPLTAQEAGSSNAVFHFASAVSAPYQVFYGTTVPSVQEFLDGNIRSGYIPMRAQSTSVSFTLEHSSCVLIIPITGGVSVTGLKLTSLDGTPLSESQTIQVTTPSGGVANKVFRVSVMPGAAKGLALDIFTSSGRMNMAILTDKTLQAGKVYEIPTITFTANAELEN